MLVGPNFGGWLAGKVALGESSLLSGLFAMVNRRYFQHTRGGADLFSGSQCQTAVHTNSAGGGNRSRLLDSAFVGLGLIGDLK
jgi:hypothetical protein